MASRQCYHCNEWIEEGAPHDCWTTTEAALTADLSEDLREAWERLRGTAVEFGDQRIYASGKAIMFSRTSCYFFVRPKRDFLEVCVLLGRTVKAPQVRRAEPASKTKIAHIIPIRHRDQVEAPITDWLQEAYDVSDALSVRASRAEPTSTPRPSTTTPEKRVERRSKKTATKTAKSSAMRTGKKGAKQATKRTAKRAARPARGSRR